MITTSGVAVASTYGSPAAIAFLFIHIGFYIVNYLVDDYDEKKSYNDAKNIEEFLTSNNFDPLNPWNLEWTGKLVDIFSEIFVKYNTQFIEILSDGKGGWDKAAMDKITQDVVFRMFDHISANTNKQTTMGELCLQSFLKGRSSPSMSFASIIKTKSLNSGPKVASCYTKELFKQPEDFDKKKFDFLNERKQKVNNVVERKFSTNDGKIIQRRTAVFFEHVSGSEEHFAKPLYREIKIMLDQMRGMLN